MLDAARYAEARSAVAGFWRRQLAEGAQLVVPEPRVLNGERALLVQNLSLSWRYSIGNPYEEFSFPESLDGAQVLAELGFFDVARTIVRASLTRRPTPYPRWKQGEKLLAAATVVRLSGDRERLTRLTPTLRAYVASLERKLGRGDLLAAERFSSDIPDSVQGLHAQAVAWQGLSAIADVWAASGQPAQAARARRVAQRLGSGLRRAVRASERRFPDGSLFLALKDDKEPYASVTESRASYWNLVAPYAFASEALRPGQRRVRRGAALPVAARLRCSARPRRRLRALRPRCAAARLSTDRCAASAPPGSSPPRTGRSLVPSLYGQLAARDDASYLRRGRGCERRASWGASRPRDVPAAEQRRERRLPRTAAAAARPGRRAAASGSRMRPARGFDRGCDRGAAGADAVQVGLRHSRGGCARGRVPSRRRRGARAR